MTHVDAWTERPTFGENSRGEAYAKFFFLLRRTPAWMQYAMAEWMEPFRLFCTYEGKRWRVTGASRLGDIWLASDFNRESGYDKRVDLALCSEWSDQPEYTSAFSSTKDPAP
jgi:hypothetical protein